MILIGSSILSLCLEALNGGNKLKSFCCRIAHKMPLLLYSEDFSGIHESPWSRNLKGVTDLKTHWMSKKICQSLFGQAATKSVLGQTVLANGTSFSPPPLHFINWIVKDAEVLQTTYRTLAVRFPRRI